MSKAIALRGRCRENIDSLFRELAALTGVTSEMDVFGEETFGPVVSVYSFDTEDEAVAAAHDTNYGFHATVWTKDAKRGQELAGQIKAGSST